MNFEELLAIFKEWVQTDEKAKDLWEKIKVGKATYKDAVKYSESIGAEWSRLLSEYDENYLEHLDDIEKGLRKAYAETAYYSKSVQSNLNKDAGIGMIPRESHIDDERVSNFMEKLASGEASWLIGKDAVENVSRSAVQDTIQTNARIQKKAGLKTYIVRHEGAGGCCAWCRSMVGRYIYGEQPKNFFQVHKDCTCWIDFETSK